MGRINSKDDSSRPVPKKKMWWIRLPYKLNQLFLSRGHGLEFSCNAISDDANSATRCALLMMTSSLFGAEQHISKRLSALAVHTRRHRGNNTRDP